MSKTPNAIPTWVSAAVLLWPFLVWLVLQTIALLVQMLGCKPSAQGPSLCDVFGTDMSALVYPLWAAGIWLLYALLWIPFGLGILGIVRAMRSA